MIRGDNVGVSSADDRGQKLHPNRCGVPSDFSECSAKALGLGVIVLHGSLVLFKSLCQCTTSLTNVAGIVIDNPVTRII